MPVLKTTWKNLVNSKMELGNISAADGKLYNSNAHIRTKDYIPINPSTNNKVTLSNNKGYVGVIFEYNENHEFIKYTAGRNDVTVVTLNSATRFIKFRTTDTSKATDLTTLFQLEYGSINSSYEPYKSNILTVNEEVELRGIGDVRDELDCLTGEVVERIKERVFNGSEKWAQNGVHSDGSYRHICNMYTDAKSSSVYVMCDKIGFADVNSSTGAGMTSDINIIKTTSKGKIQIATTKDINEFKAWLTENPVTIQYQLATESIKTVDLMITNQDGETLSNIKPIEGTMHIQTDGEPIKPTVSMEIPVEAITQNLASFIEGE